MHRILCYFTLRTQPYPDFADGVSEALVVTGFTECDGIELSFVEVGHGALPLLLAERFGGFQGILKCATVNRKQTAVKFTPLDISAFLSCAHQWHCERILTSVYSILET